MDSFNVLVTGVVIFILLILGIAFWPDPQCRPGYIYVWRAHACLEGYRP